jgi:hypothetical protein
MSLECIVHVLFAAEQEEPTRLRRPKDYPGRRYRITTLKICAYAVFIA